MVLLLTLSANGALLSQERAGPTDLQLVAGNAIVGGVTAGVRAFSGDRPILRAMLTGFVGGATHGGAKVLLPRMGLSAAVLSAVGTSIVANAENTAPLEQLVLPLGPARVRVATTTRNLSFGLNVYEAATLLFRAGSPGHRVDWDRSLQSGTVVLRTGRALMVGEGQRAAAVTTGSLITMSDLAWNPRRTFNHERIHVLQNWFLDETWSRPLETRARRATPVLRWIPGWLELGVTTPALLVAERSVPGRPLRSALEAEAEALEGRPRR